MFTKGFFYRAQMAMEELPYKVTIAIFSYMESSISRSEKRGNFFPLESLAACSQSQFIICLQLAFAKCLNGVMISSPCKQDEVVERQ